MQILKSLNQVIQFLVEMVMLVALGYGGFQLGKTTFSKYLFAVSIVGIVIVLWWLFAAPKAPYRLDLPFRLFFKLALFFIAAFLLYESGQSNLAIIFAVIAFVNEIIAAFVFRQ